MGAQRVRNGWRYEFDNWVDRVLLVSFRSFVVAVSIFAPFRPMLCMLCACLFCILEMVWYGVAVAFGMENAFAPVMWRKNIHIAS